MKIKEIKLDKGWKYLIYFDFVLPLLLFLSALLLKLPALSMLFHSYLTFVISPIPDFTALTGIIGLVFHVGVIVNAIIKKNYRELLICILITLIAAAFFLSGLNYILIKPLEFA